MKVACVLVPDFEVTAELTRYPDLAGKPVVVGGLPHERKNVRSRSQEAAAFGITEGMPLREAQGLCPETIFLPSDGYFYGKLLSKVVSTLDAFSPRVEVISHQSSVISQKLGDGGWGMGNRKSIPHPPSPNIQHLTPSTVLVFMDASGLHLLFGPDRELGDRIVVSLEVRTGLRACLGIAPSKFVAQIAATATLPGTTTIVNPGEEMAFLSPLPAEWLPCSDEMRRRLDLFGIRTMGQLASLPRGALGEQFGPEGIGAARLAKGIDERPIVVREVPVVLREEVELDPPVEANHVLMTVAARLARKLEMQMKAAFVACQDVSLDLGFENGANVHLATALHEPTDVAMDIIRAAERLIGRAYARLGEGREGTEGWEGEEEKGEGGRGKGEMETWGIDASAGASALETDSEGEEDTTEDEDDRPKPRPPEIEESTQSPELRIRSSLHHSPFTIHHSSFILPPPVSFLRLAISGFVAPYGEQMELIPTRAGELKKVRRAVERAGELFGGNSISPLEEAQGRAARERIGVEPDSDGLPHVLFLTDRKEWVREISNHWRVQGEWWRSEVLREYYRIITHTGKLWLIYQDLLGGGWYVERIYE